MAANTPQKTIVIDLSNYKDRSSARVKEGRYTLQIEDIEQGTSNKGDPMVTVFSRIVGGPEAGKNIVDRLTLNEKEMFRMVAFLQALNIPTPKGEIKLSPRKFIGQMFQADLRDGKPYNNVIRSEVANYLAIPKKLQGDSQQVGAEDEDDEGDDYDTEATLRSKPRVADIADDDDDEDEAPAPRRRAAAPVEDEDEDDEEEAPAPRKKPDALKLRSEIEAEADDEDEPEEAPVRKRRAPAAEVADELEGVEI